MAGDWIKMRTDLYRDPKVCMIADHIGRQDSDLARYVDQHCQRKMAITRNALRNVTVGALVTVWGVTRHRGKRVDDDLVIRGATLAVLDDIAEIPGFGDAMASVGWATEGDDGVVLPHFFEEYNVEPTDDQKEKNAERQRRFRESRNALRNVTVTSQSNDRVEKRRIEINSAAARHAATVEGCSDIRKIDLTPLAREVEPADLGGLANGSLLGSLTPDVIADPSLMVNWFRQQLSHEEPVTGSTGLDLFLVLAKTLDIKRRSSRLKNPAGVLVQAFRSGEWLSNRECLREAKKILDTAEATGELKWHLNGTEVDHV